MQDREDIQFITKYLKGDEASLEFLVHKYLKMIYGFVYRYVGNTADAEDLAQEVFVKVWRNLKKFDQNKNFKTWLFAIAKNTVIDFLKKKKAIPFSAFENGNGENKLIETLADTSLSSQEILEKAGAIQTVLIAAGKLSPKYRAVLSLYYNQQFNFREIAEFLKESLHTVKSRHRRAIIMLRNNIQEEW